MQDLAYKTLSIFTHAIFENILKARLQDFFGNFQIMKSWYTFSYCFLDFSLFECPWAAGIAYPLGDMSARLPPTP